MGRYHKNSEEPGLAPWVCAVCGKIGPIPNCTHRNNAGEPMLIREFKYREIRKDIEAAHVQASANRKNRRKTV
jgi:hypothetical protein